MRPLFRDGIFSLLLAAAIGVIVLSFSLIDVIAASPPHKLENGLIRTNCSSSSPM